MSYLKPTPYVFALVLSSAIAPSAKADFIDDSKMNLALRNLYFNNDSHKNTTGASKVEEWAQGFRLDYQSGFTEGTLGVGMDMLGLVGLTLDSGSGRHQGSSMIPSSGNSPANEWSRFGMSLKMRLSKTEMRIGTLMPKLPVLIANDGRVLPQTFQGGMMTSNEIEGLTLVAGRLGQATGRGSTDRTGLAVSGGKQESNQFYFGGMDYKIGSDLLVQYYQSSLEDYYRQHFLGSTHILPISSNQKLKTDLRYFRTRSKGANKSGDPGYQTAGYTRDGQATRYVKYAYDQSNIDVLSIFKRKKEIAARFY